MSTFAAEIAREDDSLSHSGETSGFASHGQNHDRIQNQDTNMAGLQSSPGDGEVEVTLLQRMSSATLGSVVTSLLGIVILPRLYLVQH